jgi:hypothetical protein
MELGLKKLRQTFRTRISIHSLQAALTLRFLHPSDDLGWRKGFDSLC